MSAYWLLFSLPLIGILMPFRLATDARRVVWLAMLSFVVMMIGLRHQVGGDWFLYLDIYSDVSGQGFFDALLVSDPAYAAVNWLSDRLGWGIYGANLVCGAVFACGFALFAARQPNPWLAWLICVPYLLIVVGMGYSRQAVALGLIFGGLAYLERQRPWAFVFFVAAATLFHKSAALVMPLAFVLRQRRGKLYIVGLGFAMLAAFAALFYARYEHIWLHYVEYQMHSEGATIRVFMNAVPAALMLVAARRWRRLWPDPGHWRFIAWGSIACVLLVGLASTAVDRVALYLAPVQIYVWCRAPLLCETRLMRTAVTLAICTVYAAVLWVWLNFAVHAGLWLPYRNVMFE